MDIAELINLGVAGVVLAWFMFRTEPRLAGIERALDRLTRAQMLTLIARPDVEPGVKREARSLLREMGTETEPEEETRDGTARLADERLDLSGVRPPRRAAR